MSGIRPDLTDAQALPVVVGCERPQVRSELEREVVGLFDEYRTRLLAYVQAFGIAGHDGEEVVQEVFLSLFRHLQMGKSRSNLRGWIYRVSHNLALKQRYASQRLQEQTDTEDEVTAAQDPQPNPEERMVSVQRRTRLLSVVSALPEQDRLCFSLRAEGFRYREIAEVLGISLGAVSISLTRSLQRLMRADEM